MIKRESHNLQMIRKFKNPGKGIDRAANRPKGNFIESQAAAYLRRLGYVIIARNYAYQGGELDIVAKDGETIVFVEVKSVWNNQQGNPAARGRAARRNPGRAEPGRTAGPAGRGRYSATTQTLTACVTSGCSFTGTSNVPSVLMLSSSWTIAGSTSGMPSSWIALAICAASTEP